MASDDALDVVEGGSSGERSWDSGDRRLFEKAAGANVAGNLLKIIVEGGIGLLFGSIVLVADAVHSLADLLASIVVFVWGRLSFLEPDETHPHGHQRIEPISALFVGVVIVLLSLLLLYESISKYLEGNYVSFNIYMLYGVAFAIVDMVVVYLYTERLNREVDSPSLNALARDCLNDIYTSFAVVVGVVGIAVEVEVLDAFTGALVSLLILHEGVKIARENLDYLVGGAPPREKQREILDTLMDHRQVHGVHDFTTHYDGHEIEVETHVEVDGDLTLYQGHEVESELRKMVAELNGIGDVHLHLDPAGIGEWKTATEDHEKGLERNCGEGRTGDSEKQEKDG
ncbi:MAG: cation diffusion facilitator family transporter [Halobacteria archaeon]